MIILCLRQSKVNNLNPIRPPISTNRLTDKVKVLTMNKLLRGTCYFIKGSPCTFRSRFDSVRYETLCKQLFVLHWHRDNSCMNCLNAVHSTYSGIKGSLCNSTTITHLFFDHMHDCL